MNISYISNIYVILFKHIYLNLKLGILLGQNYNLQQLINDVGSKNFSINDIYNFLNSETMVYPQNIDKRKDCEIVEQSAHHLH